MTTELSKSVEYFKFTSAGDHIYFGEIILPLFINISGAYKKIGLKEAPNESVKKERISNNGLLQDAYNQVTIFLKDHPVEFEVLKILLEITFIEIVKMFKKHNQNIAKKTGGVTKFTIRSRDKEFTVDIPWKNFTKKEVYERTSKMVNSIIENL